MLKLNKVREDLPIDVGGEVVTLHANYSSDSLNRAVRLFTANVDKVQSLGASEDGIDDRADLERMAALLGELIDGVCGDGATKELCGAIGGEPWECVLELTGVYLAIGDEVVKRYGHLERNRENRYLDK